MIDEFQITKRALPDRLRYLSDQLEALGETIPDEIIGVVGGVAFSLLVIAEELDESEKKPHMQVEPHIPEKKWTL